MLDNRHKKTAHLWLSCCCNGAAWRWITCLAIVISAGYAIVQPCQGQHQSEEKNISQLIGDLRSENVHVAANAAKVLGNRKGDAETVVPWLIEALVDDRHIPSRTSDHHSSSTVASHASRALSQLGAPAIPALEKVITESEDSEVRRNALRAIQRMGHSGEPAIPTLLKAINHPDRTSRLQAMYTLLAVAKEPDQFVDVFIQRLKDPKPEIRVVALRTLGQMGAVAHRAVPEMIRLLDDRAFYFIDLHMETVSGSACRTLAEMGAAGRPALPKLRQLLHDEDEYLRIDAALACARLSEQDEKALEVLIESAQSEARGFGPAYHAVMALGQLGREAESAVPVVTQLLKHKDSLVRTGAAKAIAAIVPEKACQLLIPLHEDSASVVRSEVIQLLGNCSAEDKRVFEAVVNALADESLEVRHASVDQLIRWGNQAVHAVPNLERCLQEEPNPWLREEMRKAIGKLRSENGSPD